MDESQPISRVRRRERAVEDEPWIRAFLETAQYGSVATESGGQPFLNPVIFAYDARDHALYFHTGRGGRIFANLQENPRLCFNASHLLGLQAGPSAASFDVAYESVTAFGHARLVEEEAEATRALRLLFEKYFPGLRYGTDYEPIAREQLTRTAVWQVVVEAWSGKRNPPAEAATE